MDRRMIALLHCEKISMFVLRYDGFMRYLRPTGWHTVASVALLAHGTPASQSGLSAWQHVWIAPKLWPNSCTKVCKELLTETVV
jgi:hypothetical protein